MIRPDAKPAGSSSEVESYNPTPKGTKETMDIYTEVQNATGNEMVDLNFWIRLCTKYNEPIDLSDLTMKNLSFKGTNLSWADLSKSKFNFCKFDLVNLSDVNLTNSLLNTCSFKFTQLMGADLRGADLFQSDLSWADLTNAKLRGASVYMTNLHDAILPENMLVLNTPEWQVTFIDENIQIGCKSYSREEWDQFDDLEIEYMGSNATKFWSKYKTMILMMSDTLVNL